MCDLRKALSSRPALALLLACAIARFGVASAWAQSPSTNQPWAYLLVDDSALIDDCPICGRPTIQMPLRGTFKLRLQEQNLLFDTYALEDIQFDAGGQYRLKGRGTLQIGGEVALVQQSFLELQVDDGFTNKLCYFTNGPAPINRSWPMIDLTLGQTNGTFLRFLTLRLAAAPVRDIWFSTVLSFTSSSGTRVEGGDLLSVAGRVVKRNADLFTKVGAFPPIPDLGLNAVDMLPGGEIAFALGSDIFSQTLGQLHHGDLLSTRGRILARNQELTAAFAIQPPVPDLGLDAAQVLDSGEIIFSVATNAFSEKLGVNIGRGEILSSSGVVVRTHQDLLARFHPADSAKEYGLDALYRWPGGEIWFSTEEAFQDQQLGTILGGDLLSDQGYVVFRNLELLNAFEPIEDPPEFGLDALYIVTDATPPAPAPRLAIKAPAATGDASLTWQAQGRVFQVERTDAVTVPFAPVSPIIPDLFFDDSAALTNRAQSYYRLLQW